MTSRTPFLRASIVLATDTIAFNSPPLCGRCSVCTVADRFDRVAEYIVNLEDDELPTIEGAIEWLTDAYPSCRDMLMSDDYDRNHAAPRAKARS